MLLSMKTNAFSKVVLLIWIKAIMPQMYVHNTHSNYRPQQTPVIYKLLAAIKYIMLGQGEKQVNINICGIYNILSVFGNF